MPPKKSKASICSRKLAATLLLLFLILVFSVAAVASEFLVVTEVYLREHGVKFDAESLMGAVGSSGNHTVRIYAAQVLAKWKYGKAVPVIEAALEGEKEERVRRAFASALLDLEGAKAFGIARRMLEVTQDPKERVFLVSSMASAGTSEGFPVIEQALKSSNPLVESWAVDAIADFMHPNFKDQLGVRPLKLLLDKIEDGSQEIRRKIPIVLLRAHANGVEDPKVKETLERLAKEDDDMAVRDAAKNCLEIFDIVPRVPRPTPSPAPPS